MLQVASAGKDPPKCENCFHFCAYKDICNQTDNETIKFTLTFVGNNLFINEAVPALLNKGLKKKFSYELPNAHYIKKHNPMINTTISFWHEHRRMLPIAFLWGLKKTLADYAEHVGKKLILQEIDYRTFNEEKITMPDKLLDRELREYQNEAVRDYLHKKLGIIECGTGGGKTTIAAEIIRHLGFKTLFIVNKIELLNQAKGVFEKALGIPIGIIGAGSDDIQPITVATIQTLTKNIEKYQAYLASVRVVVVDECHNSGAKSYLKLSRRLVATEYRLGLTGTAFRTDKTDLVMNAVVGFKVFELPASKLIEDGYLFKPKIIFYSDYMIEGEIREKEMMCKDGLINETDNYNSAYEVFISKNEQRNNLIKTIVEENPGKRTLIVTKLVEHGKELAELVGGKHLYGDTKLEERKQLMQDFRDGKFDVLVATMSIMGEGVDIENLELAINASGNKADIKSIQFLGRVLRLCEGKEQATFYDFIDEHRFFKHASYLRKKAFRKEGHDVEVV